MIGSNETLKGYYPCFYVNEEEFQWVKKTKGQYQEHTTTEDFIELTHRIDNNFIQGYMLRRDKQYEPINNPTLRYSYLVEYYKRQPVYFSFDHINLYQLQEIFPQHPKPLLFILKRIDGMKFVKKNQAFMVMPFHHPELEVLYSSHIKPLLASEGINIFRADDFRDNDIVIDTIYKLIEESEFIIADTTYDNKNAFYELGYGSAKEKEIIMIQNKIEAKLFFDRAHLRSILYDQADVSSFEFELKATIQSIRAKT